jgi:hypothetical protein
MVTGLLMASAPLPLTIAKRSMIEGRTKNDALWIVRSCPQVPWE